MSEVQQSSEERPAAEYLMAYRLADLLVACDEAARDEFRAAAEANSSETRSARRAVAAKLATSGAVLALAIAKITGETRHRIIVERQR